MAYCSQTLEKRQDDVSPALTLTVLSTMGDKRDKESAPDALTGQEDR